VARAARIASLGYELGSALLDDESLAKTLGIDVTRVAELSKGRLRYSAPDGVGPADLAAGAARRALADAGLTANDIDFIIFSTNTPDYTFPGSACLLQAALACATVGCLDVRAVCSGFPVALDLARRYVSLGVYERVLVAAAEVPTHQNRFDGVDPQLACLTGDAGTAAIVVAGDSSMAVLACRAACDGSRQGVLWCEFPASRHLESCGVARGERLTRSAIESGKIFPIADFAGLREVALEGVPEVFEELLVEAALTSVDALVVAHVDPRTEAELGERLAPTTKRVFASDTVYAYSASLPLALARAVEAGALERGETVALLTSGGGASWGGCIVRV
jgi:3-oxoacyl-[acyl-carrier-protein] synthase-3